MTPASAADLLRNGMGSWTFVSAALVFLAGWMLGNGGHGVSPYPFTLGTGALHPPAGRSA